MEGGDILYFVLMIILLLSGLLKKKKKAAQREEVQPMPTFSGKEINDYDDWFSNNKEEIEEVVVEQPIRQEKFIKTYENTDDFSSLRAEKQVTTRMKEQEKTDLITNDNINLEIALNTVEEARSAFIYSEIFQRKY